VLSRYTGRTGRPALPPPWAFGPWISSDIWRSGGEIRYAVTKFRERRIPVSLFARSGFTGTQAFPGCWAGDNEPNFGEANGLPSVIVAGLSAAMSGYAIWGHDVGGYQNTNFSISRPDLFMRWAQFGCFSPIMQMHRQVDPDPANLRQYPWGYTNPRRER
jgi:alpha-glucosidase (family GH31 glycosyl hydrolase)